jgi:hypothetical protein
MMSKTVKRSNEGLIKRLAICLKDIEVVLYLLKVQPALSQRCDKPFSVLWPGTRFHNAFAAVLGDQSRGGPLGNDLALVHDSHSIAQTFRLFHVLRTQQLRNTVLLEGAELLPDQVPRLRV